MMILVVFVLIVSEMIDRAWNSQDIKLVFAFSRRDEDDSLRTCVAEKLSISLR